MASLFVPTCLPPEIVPSQPMKIVIFTIGTQGDARPFVALGQGLVAHGHDVCIVTSERHKPLILGGGLSFAPIESDFADLMAQEHAAMDKGNQLRVGRQMSKALCDWMPLWVTQALEATKDADLIIGSGSGTVLGASIAEKRGLPFVQAQFMPMTPSRSVPPLWPNPRLRLPGVLNLALTHCARVLIWRFMSSPVAIMRRELSLPPIAWTGPWSEKDVNGSKRYLLYAFSRHLQPQPPDWPKDRIAVTGNWFYDQKNDWVPPPALEAFLAAGPKPLYVGFGSMMCGNPEAFTQLILKALRLTGRRAVIATGWGALKNQASHEEDGLFFIDHAPHDWLFPRMSMVVHHGGAGTVAAAARAGLPQIVIPFLADQFYWSWRLHEIGISPTILSRKHLTPETLALAIGRAGTLRITTAAHALGSLINAEHGVDRAIETLSDWGLLGEKNPSGRSAEAEGAA
ncbi:glycosyltransferase [Asaia spathodeae]|uniref:Glycosyltransferase family 1 protein n=1 Tax=Asaia spathodeae TaxID=657016 RepID=A0ABX2P0V2_9PROT|nr:glycosyltransferase [Asaia spathodeae]